jgi:hypothetical protein
MRTERTESPDFQTGFDPPPRRSTPNIEHYMNPKIDREKLAMGKFKKALRAWQQLPRKAKQQIKRKARGILGRDNSSSEKNQN